SDRGLTFAGAGSVRIPPGAMATSDPLDYDAPTLGDLAITIHIGAAPAEVTGHPGSRTTSYLQAGQWVFSAELPDAVPIDHWYVIAGLDVVAEGAAVVTLGNSITDGRGSGPNRNTRWPDNLARRLQANPRTRHVAVLNAGIGGSPSTAGSAAAGGSMRSSTSTPRYAIPQSLGACCHRPTQGTTCSPTRQGTA